MVSIRRYPLWFLLSIVILLSNSGCFVLSREEENLYNILGVRKSATIKEIKKAYRRRALESHPDKNLNVPPEEAAAEFQRVVHAFEILSDKNARRHYDRTGSTDTKNTHGPRRGGFQFHFKTSTQQPRKPQGPRRIPLKDQYNVKKSMSRVLRVTSLKQLRAIMLKEEEVHVTKKEEVLEDREEEIFHSNETMVIKKQVNVTKITTTTFTMQHETVERHLVSLNGITDIRPTFSRCRN